MSRTWRKIICDDTAALNRCQQAEYALRVRNAHRPTQNKHKLRCCRTFYAFDFHVLTGNIILLLLQESRSSLRQSAGGLTRDVAVSRVVLSCMQTLASSSTQSSLSSSSSTPSCKVNRRTLPAQKSGTPNSTRFNEYMQVSVGTDRDFHHQFNLLILPAECLQVLRCYFERSSWPQTFCVFCFV